MRRNPGRGNPGSEFRLGAPRLGIFVVLGFTLCALVVTGLGTTSWPRGTISASDASPSAARSAPLSAAVARCSRTPELRSLGGVMEAARPRVAGAR
eukprot:4465907-Pyramimonas_sp.AAC.1